MQGVASCFQVLSILGGDPVLYIFQHEGRCWHTYKRPNFSAFQATAYSPSISLLYIRIDLEPKHNIPIPENLGSALSTRLQNGESLHIFSTHLPGG
jgi:hypothetical protein